VIAAVRAAGEQRQRPAEVGDRLGIGQPRIGLGSRLLPVGDRLVDQPGRGAVIGQQLGLGGRGVGKPRLERLGDAGVQPLAVAVQQAGVGGVANQGVLEGIGRLRRRAAAIDQAGGARRARRPRPAARG
jgi:hypothetical protein